MSLILTEDSPLTALSSISSHSSGLSSLNSNTVNSPKISSDQKQLLPENGHEHKSKQHNPLKKKISKKGSLLNLNRAKVLFKKKSKLFHDNKQPDLKSTPTIATNATLAIAITNQPTTLGVQSDSTPHSRTSSITSFISKSFISLRKSSIGGASITDRSPSIEIEKINEEKPEKSKKKKRASFVSINKPDMIRSVSSQSVTVNKSPELINSATFNQSLTTTPNSESTELNDISPKPQNPALARARSKTLNLGDLQGGSAPFSLSPRKDTPPNKESAPTFIMRLFDDSYIDKTGSDGSLKGDTSFSEIIKKAVDGDVLPVLDPTDTPESYFKKLSDLDIVHNPKTLAIVFDDIKNLKFTEKIVQMFMNCIFDFPKEPLDISLRKLLLTIELPKETQQIDQMLDCFATKYYECNCVTMKSPEISDSNLCDQVTIFNSKDEVYIVTFSLLLLHTDYFNPNNKNKMPKNAFIKNTFRSLSPTTSITKEILEYYYENIIAAPFIKNKINTFEQIDFSTDLLSKFRSKSATFNWGLSNDIIDPYDFIRMNNLGALQLNFEFNWINYFKIRKIDKDFLKNNIVVNLFSNQPMIQIILNLPQAAFLLQNENIVVEKATNFSKGFSQEPNESTYLSTRIIKMGYILKREKLGSSTKLLSLTNEVRYTWKRYFVVLTTIGLHFFNEYDCFIDDSDLDSIEYLFADFKNINEQDGVILNIKSDRGVESNIRPLFSFPMNELFATQVSSSPEIEIDEFTFLVYTKNDKNFYKSASAAIALSWVDSINYTTSLCNMKGFYKPTQLINENENGQILGEICSKHYISIEEKAKHYTESIELEIRNILESFKQAKHYSVMAPLNSKTKETLSHNARLLKYKIDASWFEISKYRVMRNVILEYIELEKLEKEDIMLEDIVGDLKKFGVDKKDVDHDNVSAYPSPNLGDSGFEVYPSPNLS